MTHRTVQPEDEGAKQKQQTNRKGHNQSSAAVLASGQYQLTVATFHKRNQDTNSFRTGQQFLIKLDLRSPPSEPLKSPMSLILPRRMIQGHQKARQPDTLSVDAASAASPANSTLEAAPPQAPDIPDALAGDPESHFYLEVTVHLASSEAIVQACPECCHKVDAKVRKPSNGPGAPSKAHGANDNVDPGQILQFCVSDHVVDFTHGTSTVMAKVLCSSTHHDKRGNNDRYFFKFSLMQYLGGQKIRVGSCRTKDILFTGNHKNKSMASFSEDKGDVKPRIPKPEDDASTGAPPSMVMGQSFYSEEPDSIHEDMHDRTHAHAHGSPHLPGGRSSHHQSFATYGSLRQHTDGHLPRIQEPTAMSMDSPRQRHHFTDKDTYDSASSRSPLSTQGTAARFTGQSPTDPKLVGHGGFAPVKSKSWNDTLVAPKITRIIPDVGDMLGGTEVTIFGSGFRAGLVPYFDSLPATNVTVLHSDVLTCRTPPRIHPVVASVGIRSKHSSNVSHSRTAPDAQFSYADKTGMVLAELVAEILVMGWDDYGEPRLHRSGTNLSASHNESGDRTEPRLGGLGDLRSRATRVVRRGSMRRDSSDISTQRSGSGGSRLNPMTESPRRRSTHSPLSHEQSLEDDEELERLVTEMMSISVTHSVVPTTQTSKALESAIMNIVRNGDELHHISMQNDQRHTMLHLAVLLEMNQLVDYLLKEKIEINAADWNGFTGTKSSA
ncbi:hypothetical protein BGZ67_007695 [Mortierella alpina]|nr:hypothetical protein BGZ67_007695 [Mortierella alpina]